ncbi:GIN domain-containing protein [Tenacibaculum aestuariivivum]|uniref:GIN domain-containing protein n=1 Tax=Tenacibaculum aestuariivivum TaxID=2006131 RepID=UPI003AB545FC
MNKVNLLVVVLIFNLTCFSQKKEKIKGDKNVTTITKTISKGFNAVEVDDALELTIKQGGKNSYTITADNNLQDIIRFTVVDSILKINTINRITSSKKLEIGLMFKNLEHIIVKNDAQVEGEGSIESSIVRINAYDSSKFDFDIKATDIVVTMQKNTKGKLKGKSTNTTIIMNDRSDLEASVVADKTTVTLTKSAELKLEGNCDLVDFNLKDETELDARKMKVASADLYTSDGSEVFIYVDKKLDIYAKGKSTIYVYGDPKFNLKGLRDKSKIIKK